MAIKGKPKTKKVLTQEAQAATLTGDWAEVIRINDEFLERFPRDPEALNRKGRAYLELRQLSAAWDAYSEALKADPANMIARRNLQRLETLRNRETTGENPTPATIPNSAVFIEEVGKTWVDELANPADLTTLVEVSPGAKLNLKSADGHLIVVTDEGVRLGEVEARTGSRLIDLIEGGNVYEVYALGISGHSLRVILREVFRDPSQATKIAFPRQVNATQDLMRERELLFQRDESEFSFSDEDEDDGEIEDETVDEDDSDEDRNDAAAYVDDIPNDYEDDAM